MNEKDAFDSCDDDDCSKKNMFVFMPETSFVQEINTHLGSVNPTACFTLPRYVLRSYCETGRSLVPGNEADMARESSLARPGNDARGERKRRRRRRRRKDQLGCYEAKWSLGASGETCHDCLAVVGELSWDFFEWRKREFSRVVTSDVGWLSEWVTQLFFHVAYIVSKGTPYIC